MTIDVSDPHIRREIEARLERMLDSDPASIHPPDDCSIIWIGKLAAHLLHVILAQSPFSS